MKVSIIIPIYNVEKYVKECLDSVISQTMHEGVECILVDDCGIDNSIAIVENYVTNYSGPIKFTILHHDHNQGLSSARNTGIKAAKGDYVLFVDSDDKLFPNSLTDLINIATKYPDAEMVQGSTTPGFILSKENKPEFSNDSKWIRKGLCTYEISDPAWNKLIKREFITNNNLYFQEGFLQEDTLWSWQVHKYIQTIAFCFDITYWYRFNPEGIMNGMANIRSAKSFARIFNYVFDDIIQGEKIEDYEIKYLIWVAKHAFHYVGKREGNKLLVTQNNPTFNKVLKWSTGLSRIHNSKIRNILLILLQTYIVKPNIQKLCNKQCLLRNFTKIDYSQRV